MIKVRCKPGGLKRRLQPVGKTILLNGGVGDFFAVESVLTPEERERLETVHYCCPNAAAIEQVMRALPNYPNLKHHVIRLYRGRADSARLASELHADNWSIKAVFPQQRPYMGSSVLQHRLADPTLPGKPYAVVCGHSTWGKHEGRSFTDEDWLRCRDWCEERGLLGVLIGNDAVAAPPELLDLRHQTSILESIEILKGAKGYCGIDTCWSVLGAKLFPEANLCVKAVKNAHCRAHLESYFLPRTTYGFLRERVEWEPTELTVNVCQGVGDTFWTYQKLAPYHDRINFNVCLVNGKDDKVHVRALEWLRLLPKVGTVQTVSVPDARYRQLAESEFELPLTAGVYDYAVNGPLERGVRLDEIDPLTSIAETVELPTEQIRDVDLSEPYLLLYVSGATLDEVAAKKESLWDVNQWVAFARRFMEATGLTRVIVNGAGYDEAVTRPLAKRLGGQATIDLRAGQVLTLIKNCSWFLGYQSGLSVMADQFDRHQLMIYFPRYKKLMNSWPKRRNIGVRYFADTFDRTPDEILANFRARALAVQP